MPIERILQSKLFRGVIVGVGICTIALIIFAGGVAIGGRKALFACKWNENYNRNFGGRAGFFPPEPPPFRGHMVGAHGVLGSIVSVLEDSIVVQGKDGIERNIMISDDTNIRRDNAKADRNALKIGDAVMVFGEPDDSGRIKAVMIRILR